MMGSIKLFNLYESPKPNLLGIQTIEACDPLTPYRLTPISCVSPPPSTGGDVSVIKNFILRGKTKRQIWKKRLPSTSSTTSSSNGVNKHELHDIILLKNITPESNIQQCNTILKHLEQSGDDHNTLTFFHWMRTNSKLKHNITAFNLALRAFSRNQDWVAAENILLELISLSPTQLTFQLFNTLIYASYKKGLPHLGTKWFRMMLDNGVHPNIATFGMLMSLYKKCGNLEDAEFAFNQMRRLKLKCHSAYSSMITLYTRLGLHNNSEDIIRFMKQDNLIPNSENWLVQINAYSQQGKLQDAQRVLISMMENGVPPNIVAYNTLITGYGKVSDMDSAQSIFRNLPSIGLKPDETTYRSMVEGWGRANRYKEAKWYYQQLKTSGSKPNSSNIFTMINLQARHKDEDGALETLQDMRMMGCEYSSILTTLLQAYEKVDRVDKVPLVVKGSFYQHVLVEQTSCSILVMAYVKHRLIDDALRVLREKQWKDPFFEDNLYHLLICSCKESGFYEDAIKLFTHMPKSDAKPNLHITCTMIDIYSIIGCFSKGINLYLKLSSSGTALDMVAYSIVVRMYVKAGALEDACLVLEKMDKQKDIIPDTFLFRDMLRIYQQCGSQEKLAELYFKLLKSEVAWDQEMYNCIINCCAHALPVDELTRIFDEMLQRGFSPNTNTFNTMLDVYGKRKLLKKARKVFWMARTRGLADAVSYNTMIAAYGQSKDFANMRATVRKMEFSGFPVSLEVYNCMLDAYGKDCQMEKFTSVLQRLKESSCVLDHYTYGILINIYGEQGLIEEVTAVLSEQKDHGLEPNLCNYNTLIKAYGIAGMVEEAVDVVKEMRAKGIEPDHITYINLVHALQRNDNFLEAVKWSLWMKQMGISSPKY